jgi:hypothetical protein
VFGGYAFKLRREDDGHDNAIDGYNFAEYYGDKILGAYSRGFDAAAYDGGSCDEYSPNERFSRDLTTGSGEIAPCCSDD